LEDNVSNVFLRGHDHRTMGYEMYGGKMLTIHSSSRYKNRGAKGIQIVRAMVHSKKKIRRVNDIKFLHLEGEKMHAAVPSKLE
ncbi:MAG: hypothetical protein U9R75_06185, partial [Candidatus Thermoplasmatota archaeon]|nr:hypothetical protein [Candidatus Thermoplasmatota archaeon]